MVQSLQVSLLDWGSAVRFSVILYSFTTLALISLTASAYSADYTQVRSSYEAFYVCSNLVASNIFLGGVAAKEAVSPSVDECNTEMQSYISALLKFNKARGGKKIDRSLLELEIRNKMVEDLSKIFTGQPIK